MKLKNCKKCYEEKNYHECNHDKGYGDLPATQYRCTKCGEWVSELYFCNLEERKE